MNGEEGIIRSSQRVSDIRRCIENARLGYSRHTIVPQHIMYDNLHIYIGEWGDDGYLDRGDDDVDDVDDVDDLDDDVTFMSTTFA